MSHPGCPRDQCHSLVNRQRRPRILVCSTLPLNMSTRAGNAIAVSEMSSSREYRALALREQDWVQRSGLAYSVTRNNVNLVERCANVVREICVLGSQVTLQSTAI